jgi:hypothetical protein
MFMRVCFDFKLSTAVLNTLVPCLNDKEFYKAYMRTLDDVKSEQRTSCE